MTTSASILIIDDEPIVRDTLGALLGENYQLYFAENGVEGLACALQTHPDLILLDVMMPKLDGFEVCSRLRATPDLHEVPIIMITALDDRESRLRGLRVGVDDFLGKPFDSLELLARAQTITRLNRYRHLMDQRNKLEVMHQELLISYQKTIEGWSRALDLRDKETEGHSNRVTQKCVDFAKAVGLSAEQLNQVRMGALLHDVGKLGIPDAILHKPGKLSAEEWVIMRRHPEYAYQWLSSIKFLEVALDIPYCHHEKWDGTGYPRGLVGTNIPLFARLFAIVDVWDALSHNRPYRQALPEEEVLAYILSEAGKHFDPELVKAFIQMQTAKEVMPV